MPECLGNIVSGLGKNLRLAGEKPAAAGEEPRNAGEESAFACELCSDRGFVVAANVATPCACRGGYDAATALRRAGVPVRYLRFTRASWEQRWGAWAADVLLRPLSTWPAQAAEFDPDDWLVLLTGLYGRRKTSLGTALFGQALQARGAGGMWLDMNEWVDELERAIRPGEDGPGAAQLFERAQNAPVLLLDDLGAVRGARAGARSGDGGWWWRERVAALVRSREAWCRPTIITMNGALGDLDAIDRSLRSRMTVRLHLDMAGPDFRQAGRKA